MSPAVRTLAVLLVIVAAVGSCRSVTGKSAGNSIDDATITASVKTRGPKARLASGKSGRQKRRNP